MCWNTRLDTEHFVSLRISDVTKEAASLRNAFRQYHARLLLT